MHGNHHDQRLDSLPNNNNNGGSSLTNLNTIGRSTQQQQHHNYRYRRHHNWMLSLCFRGQKVLRVPPAPSDPPESVVFELSEQ